MFFIILTLIIFLLLLVYLANNIFKEEIVFDKCPNIAGQLCQEKTCSRCNPDNYWFEKL